MARTKDAKNTLGELDAKAVTRLVGAASDIALVLDDEGTIIEVMTQRDELGARGAREWLGRPWVQTVTIESRQKVEALLREAQAAVDAAGRWRQVNHPGKDGDDLPLLYSTLRVVPDDGRSGKGRIVAFGRDLRDSVALQRRLIESQQAMERDYWRYREAETRYRHLFETTAEAVLIVDGSTQKVLEANPAARTLCGTRRARLVGAPLSTLVRAAACRAAAEPGGRGSHRRSPGRLARATGRRRRRGVGVGLGLPPGRCRVRAGAPGAAARRNARGTPAQRRLIAPGRRDRRRRDAAGLSAQLARRPGVLRCRRARADGQPCLRRAGPAQRRGAGARPGAGPLDRPHRRRARAC